MPSVLWRCWLSGRKGIRPVKNWVVGCWRGYLSGARCRLADATSWCHCHSLSLASVKSRLVLPFWYWLTRVVPEKGPLNVCVHKLIGTRKGSFSSNVHYVLSPLKHWILLALMTLLNGTLPFQWLWISWNQCVLVEQMWTDVNDAIHRMWVLNNWDWEWRSWKLLLSSYTSDEFFKLCTL